MLSFIEMNRTLWRMLMVSGGLLLLWVPKQVFGFTEWPYVLLFVAIAWLGVPHGALDHEVGRPYWQTKLGKAWNVGFLGSYLGLGVVFIALWVAMPLLGLQLFLLLSVLHFGQEDSAELQLDDGWYWTHVAFRGLLPLCAAAYFSLETTASLFEPLLLRAEHTHQAQHIAIFGSAIFPLLCLLGVLVYALWWNRTQEHRLIAELSGESALIVLCFAALPPLEGFVVYFCAHHAWRHSLELAEWRFPQDAQPLRRFWRETRPLTYLTLGGGFCCWLFWADSSLAWGGMQVLFIGLAALTLPHVVTHGLAFGWKRPLPSVHPLAESRHESSFAAHSARRPA